MKNNNKYQALVFIVFYCLLLACSHDVSNEAKHVNAMSNKTLKKLLRRESISAAEIVVDSILNIDNITEEKKAILYLEKGRNYFEKGKNEEALQSLNFANETFNKLSLKALIMETNLQIVKVNIQLENISESALTIDEIINFFKEKKNYIIVAEALVVKGGINYVLKNYDTSVLTIKETIIVQELLNDTSGIATSYNNMGLIYDIQKKDELALFFYKKAVNIQSSLSKNYKSSAHNNLAALYADMKNYNESIKILLEALQIDFHSKNISNQIETLSSIVHVSMLKNDFKSAMVYSMERDSIKNIAEKEEKVILTKLIEKKYKLLNKEKELIGVNKINKKNKILLIVMLVLLGLITILGYLKYKNTKLKLNYDKMQLEQTVLRAQMNPHFIFNTLSAIQNSLLDNKPIESASYISKFAKLIRQNFSFISKEKISLAEEIDALKNYLDTQKIRFKDKFDYEFNIQESIDVYQNEIPPLMLQPFVENAIEHGFKNIKHKGKIIITINLKNEYIHINISDNGKGFEVDSTKNEKLHSLEVFKKRLKLLGKKVSRSFSIKSTQLGTEVSFFIKQ